MEDEIKKTAAPVANKEEAPVKVKTEAPKVEEKPKTEKPAPKNPVATVKSNQLNKPEVKVKKAGHGAPTKASSTEMDKILAMVKALPVKSVSRKQYTEMLRILPLKIQR